jgi:tetratricopeptide (TPR) repeat protein
VAEARDTVAGAASDRNVQAASVDRTVPGTAAKRFISPGRLSLMFGGVFALACAVFSPGFQGRMVYDSITFILANSHIFARHDLLDAMRIVPQRPLFMATILANYLLTGMDPFWFRVVNTAICAGAGVGLAVFILMVFDSPALSRSGSSSQKPWVAAFLGVLYVIHPLQCFVILYIVMREAALACFFYYWALAAYLAVRSGRFGCTPAAYGLVSVLFLAGMLSKENVITLPVVMVLMELILYRQDFSHLLRRAGAICLIIAPSFVMYLVLTHALQSADTPSDMQGVFQRLFLYYRKANITPLEVALTQCRVMLVHLSTILAPGLQDLQLLRAETISRTLWNPPLTWAAVLALIGLLGTSAALCRRAPAASLGILFFFVALAPESFLIPQYLYCGYRGVLPMAGVMLVVAQAMMELFERIEKKAIKIGTCAACLVPLVWVGFVSFWEAHKWDPLPVWKTAFENLPSYGPDVERYPYQDVLVGYGTELSRSGKHEAAIGLLREAMDLDPDPRNDKTSLAAGNLGLALFHQGNREEGLALLQKAVDLSPHVAWTRYNFGVALINSGKTQEGTDQMRQAANLYPTDPEIRMGLADVLRETGKFTAASEEYEEAIKLDPRSVDALTGLGIALEKSGNLPRAVETYRKAISLSPRSAQLRVTLAIALAKMGDTKEAVDLLENAIQLNPELASAHENLGVLMLRMGRFSDAVMNLQRAVDRAGVKADADVFFQLGMAFAASGKPAEAVAAFQKALALKPEHEAARQNLDRLLR